MKNKITTLFFLIICFFSFSQDTLFLTERDLKPNKNNPAHLKFALQKNDKLIFTFKTKRNKPIPTVQIYQKENILFEKNNLKTKNKLEIKVPQTGIIDIYFYGNLFGFDINVYIERITAQKNGKFYNTALQVFKKYDTSYYEYKIDSVVGYEEIRTPKNFRVIKSAEYESSALLEKKINLKSGKTKGIFVTKPQENVKTKNKDMKFMGYQVMITSAAGAEKMWKYIGLGVDVGCLCLSLAFPAAGTAAGLGIETAFEMIGPQEGGEPVYYIITNKKKELDKFTDKDSDTNPAVFESGLATGYNGTWFPVDTLAIGLKNLNSAVEIDVSLNIYAIYQSTVFENIKQDIITIKPKTVEVTRTLQVIKNTKTLKHQP